MSTDQALIVTVLALTMALFVWGRWRYDLVAVTALLAATYLGLVPAEHAFAGFGHPAVVTVAAVLMISRALQASGVVDVLAGLLARVPHTATAQVGAHGLVTAVFSAFMNNVGALALMLPVALRNLAGSPWPPSTLLMPLSFASLLGGLVTVIGTPPNIIIATFRAELVGEPFGMFDFTPVGLPVAVAGMLFVTLAGWRLLPRREEQRLSGSERFSLRRYVSQATLPADSPLVGSEVRDIERLCSNEVTVMAIIRGDRRIVAPRGAETMAAQDVIVLEGDAAALKPLFEASGLVHVGSDEVDLAGLESDDVQVIEVVVMPGSPIEGSSMRGLRMHEHFGINLLAVARKGGAPMTRLGNVRFRVGDVLLLQGERKTLREEFGNLGCVPLRGRGLSLQTRRRVWLPVATFAAAILATSLGVVPIQIAFVSAVAVLLLSRSMTLRDAYRSIEWPVIILLGALIPVGEALHATGTTLLIAQMMLDVAGDLSVAWLLALLMAVSMLLSDLVHNSPTAILMAPIAISLADALGLGPDAFLMAVAIGAASPYLTPVGHQSNTLVMGPGGYRFGDYWRMGLPLDMLILIVAVPLIMLFWIP
jgi:di/tricarboxylate transporter